MFIDPIYVQVVVNLDPFQLARLLEVKNFACPDESFDKMIGDVIEIALRKYKVLAEGALTKKEQVRVRE